MATMKSNNAAIAAMQQMLQERCIAEPHSLSRWRTRQEYGRRSKLSVRTNSEERSVLCR